VKASVHDSILSMRDFKQVERNGYFNVKISRNKSDKCNCLV
jgi:hypothetical protein